MMTKDLAKVLRAELMDAAKAIAAKHGYDVKSGSGTYSDASFKIANVEFILSKTVAAATGVKTPDERDFEFAMNATGFGHVKMGMKFNAPRIGEVTISGYKKTARKYPVIVTDASGKSYKIGFDVLSRHFAK